MKQFEKYNKKDDTSFLLYKENLADKFDSSFKEYPDLLAFFANYGGTSYDRGLFRIHSKSSSYYWTKLIIEFFPKYADRICCFGYDWMGRNFAVDLLDPKKNYLFDPATGEDFELPQSLTGFFNEELVHYKDETLVPDDFNYILNKFKIDLLPTDKCIGYDKLLFLGGEDDLDNMEIIDMDVYWDINYKVYSKIQNLEEGSIIDKLKIE